MRLLLAAVAVLTWWSTISPATLPGVYVPHYPEVIMETPRGDFIMTSPGVITFERRTKCS